MIGRVEASSHNVKLTFVSFSCGKKQTAKSVAPHALKFLIISRLSMVESSIKSKSALNPLSQPFVTEEPFSQLFKTSNMKS